MRCTAGCTADVIAIDSTGCRRQHRTRGKEVFHAFKQNGACVMGVDAEWVLVNIVGNLGVLLLLVAYFALLLEKAKADELPYLLPNLCGSLCIGVSLFYNFNLPSVVIEVCWTSITLYGLAKLAFRKIKCNRGSERVSSPGPSNSSVIVHDASQEEDCNKSDACEETADQEGLSETEVSPV